MNPKQIAFNFLKQIENSSNKKDTIKRIADTLNTFDTQTRQAVYDLLLFFLKELDKQKYLVFEHTEIRSSANDDYLEYMALLSSLVKEK